MRKKEKIIWLVLAIIGIASLYLVVVLSFWLYSKNRIYPGVSVVGVSLSGKTKDETEKILKEKAEPYLLEQINLSANKTKTIKLSDLGVKFDYSKTYDQALGFGSANPFVLGMSRDYPLEFSFDEEAFYGELKNQDKEISSAIVNSRTEKKGEELKVIDGTNGNRVNYAETIFQFIKSVGSLENNLQLSTFIVPPTFTSEDLADKISDIKAKTKNSIVLTDGNNNFQLTPEELVSFVTLNTGNRSLVEEFEGNVLFKPIFENNVEGSLFSPNLVSGFLTELSKNIDTSPINAKLTISGGKATVFVSSKDGKTLNVESSTQAIIDGLESDKTNIKLVVDVKKPEIREDSLGNMGISELLSSGYSNFSGSPGNRLHNIRTGASKFNGVLIKPGQDFSFNETLGPVDASTGYLPELVIKEKKTIPEYGGGMCQVSSTAFRAALNAGLPILERTYHAYPVVYYKPYGVDATVYLPKPDLVFKNDTGKYILVQTRILGNNLYFDFYGTKPARLMKFAGNENGAGAVFPVEQVTPMIYDQGARGNGSFTAVIWRLIYDSTGKLTDTDKFVSKYDSPDKYPH